MGAIGEVNLALFARTPAAAGLLALVSVAGAALPRSASAQDAATTLVPMRDGVKLATDVYLPPTDEKHGAVLVRTPYGRKAIGGRAKQAVLAGFAVVIQDDRGRGDSEGEKLPFAGSGWGERGDDGSDTIAWIQKQSWASGKVATYGASALGIVQYFTAADRPDGLVAQWIEVAGGNLYEDGIYPGGILREEQARGWTVQNRFDPKALELTLAHPLFDEYWKLFDARSQTQKVNVPGTFVAGWYDTFVQGEIASFRERQERGGEKARGQQHLIVGPWTHTGRGKTHQGELDFPAPSAQPPGQVGDPLRYFGQYLDGLANGVEKDPAVTYYVLGKDEWRQSAQWPPAGAAEKTWCLHGTGELSRRPLDADEKPRHFRHDPKDPVRTIGGRNLTVAAGPCDQRPIEDRKDVLVWTSGELEAPLDVAGEVKAKLTVSSSATDVDVHVRVTDVLPDGRSILLIDGARRASVVDGFASARPLEPGKPVTVSVDLGPIAAVVDKGHRLRVLVSGSNTPRYAVQPLASENDVLSAELTLPEVAAAPAGKVWR